LPTVVVAGHKSRKNARAHVALVARYRSPTAFEFVEEECSDLSSGGMFIRSPAPAPTGTLLKLECDVDHGQGIIRGVARVVWLREREADGEPRGMGVKFVKLEPGGRELIASVLERVGGDEGAGITARSSIPPRMSEPPRPSQAERVVQPASTAPPMVSEPPIVLSDPSALVTDPPAPLAAESKPVAQPAPAASPASPATSAIGPKAKPAVEPKPSESKSATPSNDAKSSAKSSAKSTKSSTKNAPSTKSAPSKKPSTAPRSTATTPTHRPPARAVDGRAIAFAIALFVGVAAVALLSRKPAEPQPAAELQPLPVEPSPPAVMPHVLKLTTLPDAARVTVGNRAATSPVTLELGVLSAPIEVRAEKEGFEPVTISVELARFEQQGDKRVATVMLALPPLPQPEAQAPVVAAEPQPAAAQAQAEEAKPQPAEPVADAKADDREAARAAARERRAERRAAREAEAASSTAASAAPAPAAAAEPATTPPAAPPAPAPVLAIAPAAPAAAPVAPAPAPAAAEQAPAETPLQAARACLARGDNACVLAALEGKARSAQELELLIETHRSMGHNAAVERNMRVYVERFPSERRAEAYAKQLGIPSAQ
jgi:uncharacterized protein (TIGR02266 family)